MCGDGEGVGIREVCADEEAVEMEGDRCRKGRGMMQGGDGEGSGRDKGVGVGDQVCGDGGELGYWCEYRKGVKMGKG